MNDSANIRIDRHERWRVAKEPDGNTEAATVAALAFVGYWVGSLQVGWLSGWVAPAAAAIAALLTFYILRGLLVVFRYLLRSRRTILERRLAECERERAKVVAEYERMPTRDELEREFEEQAAAAAEHYAVFTGLISEAFNRYRMRLPFDAEPRTWLDHLPDDPTARDSTLEDFAGTMEIGGDYGPWSEMNRPKYLRARRGLMAFYAYVDRRREKGPADFYRDVIEPNVRPDHYAILHLFTYLSGPGGRERGGGLPSAWRKLWLEWSGVVGNGSS